MDESQKENLTAILSGVIARLSDCVVFCDEIKEREWVERLGEAFELVEEVEQELSRKVPD